MLVVDIPHIDDFEVFSPATFLEVLRDYFRQIAYPSLSIPATFERMFYLAGILLCYAP
jgi:hypothetical protein